MKLQYLYREAKESFREAEAVVLSADEAAELAEGAEDTAAARKPAPPAGKKKPPSEIAYLISSIGNNASYAEMAALGVFSLVGQILEEDGDGTLDDAARMLRA